MKQARFFGEACLPGSNWESGLYYQRLQPGTVKTLNKPAQQSHLHLPPALVTSLEFTTLPKTRLSCPSFTNLSIFVSEYKRDMSLGLFDFHSPEEIFMSMQM